MPEPASDSFDWSDFAFGSRKVLQELKAIYIPAPREISPKRFAQLIKAYLPKGNILLGLSKERFVRELEGQPQFATLQPKTVQPIIGTVNASKAPHKIYTLHHSQRDTIFIFEKVRFQRVLLIQGSWYKAFHFRPEYYALVNRGTPYHLLSPFADEQEAMQYPLQTLLPSLPTEGQFDTLGLLDIASQAARHSYDYGGFQTGVALGISQQPSGYRLLMTAHNTVVPYETYAMHYGASREKYFSPMQDMNHYDTIHAEMALVIKAQKAGIDLSCTTLFINLLPCPQCSRTLSQTDIAEIVYTEDHTAGYAVQMLEKAGKKIRRVVPPAQPQTMVTGQV